MKIIKTSSAIFLIFIYGYLFAKDVNSAKSRVLIYNFQQIKQSPVQSEVQTKQTGFQYYSFVIPETISKMLNESGKFNLSRNNSSFLREDAVSLDMVKENYTGRFQDTSKTSNSDFMVTGIYEVINGKLIVRIYIYNASLNEIQEVSAEKDETGVYLKETTDLLSENIEQKLAVLIVNKIEKTETSPFLPMAKPLQYTSIGFDYGYLYLSGKWKDVYNNTEYYSPYITFDLASFLDLSLKYDYFQTDSENKDTAENSSIRVMSGIMDFNFKYQIIDNISIYLTAGGGLTSSKITLNTGQPFSGSPAAESSTDPSAETGLGFKINLSSIQIKSGFLYKRIFLKDEPMNMTIIYAGAGIHF